MGFSFKVAPGVRIRASSRGIRTSVGPRAARVHVGAGRTGFSSGAGPVSFYTSVGGGRRGGGRSGSRPPSMASYQRQLAAAEKAEEAQRLAAALQEILNVHRAEFPPAVPPMAPPPSLPDARTVHRRHEREALAGIGLLQRAARAESKQRAARAADAELAEARQQAADQQAEWQRQLDRRWQQLCDNDPDVVLATLAEAFEDNEAPAAPVAVDGTELALVVLAPADDVVPERMPDRTKAGNLTLRKLPKGERSALYSLLVFGHLVVTMREAFAVAPGITAIRSVLLRHAGADAYGKPRLDCLLAGRFLRSAFEGVRWQEASAGTIVEDTATELLVNLRRGTELQPST
jgi:type II secretory pathway pseudopilin PulG